MRPCSYARPHFVYILTPVIFLGDSKKYATDFRSIARNALAGRWTITVIAGLIASPLGAVASDGPEFNLNFNESVADIGLELAGQQIYTTYTGWNETLTGFVIGTAAIIVLVFFVMAVAYLILGSVVGVGYSRGVY